MELLKQSDEDIMRSSAPILSSLIAFGNDQDWSRFSSLFIEEGQTDEAKHDVQKQWQTNPVLTAFEDDVDFLGVLRRTDHLLTLWKMRSKQAPDDILGLLGLKEIDGEIKVNGYRIK